MTVWESFQRIIGFGQPKRPRRCLIGFIFKVLNDWTTDFSALLSYNFIIAILPLATAAFGIFGLVFRHNSDARTSVINSIVDSLPDNRTKLAVQQVTYHVDANVITIDSSLLLRLLKLQLII